MHTVLFSLCNVFCSNIAISLSRFRWEHYDVSQRSNSDTIFNIFQMASKADDETSQAESNGTGRNVLQVGESC